MQIFKKFYLLVLMLLISCIKEIDISEFSEDFINYEPELRIEALILPTENTAIVRIDKSVLINDLTLYNCKDDDYGIISQDDCNALGGTWHGKEEDSVADCGDWVAGKFVCWTCSGNDYIQKDVIDTNFINNMAECNQSCIEASYLECTEELNVQNQSECEGLGGQWSWFILHDVGEDGLSGDPTDEDEDCEDCNSSDTACLDLCRNEYSIGENNGVPDCNEPNVDETNEVIQNVHAADCIVEITKENNEQEESCIFEYSETAGSFFYDSNLKSWENSIDNIETPTYGAYIPGDCAEFSWNDLNAEYNFKCSCPGYGEVESNSTIKISPPVVFYNNSDIFTESGDMQNFTTSISLCTDNDCLKNYSSLWDSSGYDTLYFGKNSYNEYIYYSSISPYFYYQNVQYYYDYSSTPNRYLYYHGHPDGATEVENIYGNASLIGESVITVELNEFPNTPNINKFYYEMFTFSESYKNYYFFDLLDLRDPVRTNLRKKDSEETVMGAFGSMSSERVYFELVDCEEYVLQEECEAPDITKNVCSWYPFSELPSYVQENIETELTTSECQEEICRGGILDGHQCVEDENCIMNADHILSQFNLCGPRNFPPPPEN